MTTTTIIYDLRIDANCAFTKNGWKVIFPILVDDDDSEDLEFKQTYKNAIDSAKGEIMKRAEFMSTSNYTVGQWTKAVSSNFSEETKKLHDLVMGNGCNDLMFNLEVIDERLIKVS